MSGESSTTFLESRATTQMTMGRSGRLQSQHEVTCGVGINHAAAHGSRYRWYVLATESCMQVPPHLPNEIHEMAHELHGTHMHRADDSMAHDFALLAERTQQAGVNTELSLHIYDQQVAIQDDTAVWQRDHRRCATLHVRASGRADQQERSISRSYACASLDELRLALPDLVQSVNAVATEVAAFCQPVPCPEGEMPVILAAGHAAVFFHEVCGHPLEGDIVISNTSYLAPWIGRRVADERLTVVDDPTPAASTMSQIMDDEGTPARPAFLIEHGVVREPLLDKRSARILGLEPNGHGRRLDFRHYALPRMTHTQVRPHAGTAEEASAQIERGLLITKLKLRHMNIASGDFSFTITEGRLIEHGRPGPYIGPGLLYGNGLECLREIDFVGADDERFLHAGAGCGKLDQWPLIVSFGQPSVRFQRLRVQPW